MDVLDAIKTRKSTRNFKPEMVSLDILDKIITASAYATHSVIASRTEFLPVPVPLKVSPHSQNVSHDRDNPKSSHLDSKSAHNPYAGKSHLPGRPFLLLSYTHLPCPEVSQQSLHGLFQLRK